MSSYDRKPIIPLVDAWLLDSAGVIVGVELAQARNQVTYLVGSATDGSIVADVVGNLTGNVVGNVTGNVVADTITATGAVTLAEPTGFFGNLHTVVSGTPGLTLVKNSQMVMYSPFTVQNAAGVTIEGEMRIYDWPV